MISADYKTIFASVRPSRVAVLVDQHDPDWRDTSVRVIEFFTTLWGGKHNIIVPTDGNTVDDCFWDILETFDPDYVFTYRKTLGDLKLSNPEKYAQIAEREATQFIKENPGADREMASDPRPAPAFERQPFPDGERTLIESRCVCCGFRIVATPGEYLQEDEANHLAKCPGLQQQRTA